jgi:hypothetical protein
MGVFFKKVTYIIIMRYNKNNVNKMFPGITFPERESRYIVWCLNQMKTEYQKDWINLLNILDDKNMLIEIQKTWYILRGFSVQEAGNGWRILSPVRGKSVDYLV